MRFLSLGDLPTPHSATRNHKLKNRDPICSRSLVMQGVGITLEVKIYDLRARLEGAHGGGGDDGGGGVQGGSGRGVQQAGGRALLTYLSRGRSPVAVRLSPQSRTDARSVRCFRGQMADDDVEGLLSDDEDDGPQHDPGNAALVVAPQPPAQVPLRTPTLQVRATPIGRAAPTELGGNQRKAVWSLYKNVMSSVFDGVRQLVEQEGLEPSVATDIREVRPRAAAAHIGLCAAPLSASQLP